MLGSPDIAERVALKHYLGAYEPDIQRLGAGAFRVAYRGDDGLVYKVGSDHDNIEEAENAAKAISLGVPGIPVVETYTVSSGHVVNVMPFVSKMGIDLDPDDYQRARSIIRKWRNVGFQDIHDKNWGMTPDGQFWLTDLQFAMLGGPVDATDPTFSFDQTPMLTFTSPVLFWKAKPEFKSALRLGQAFAKPLRSGFNWFTDEQLMIWDMWGGNPINS